MSRTYHVSASWHVTQQSCHTTGTSHSRHVTQLPLGAQHSQQSCHTCHKVLMSHMSHSSHVTYVTQHPCHTCRTTVMSCRMHISSRHVTHFSRANHQTCQTYRRVMSHVWIMHVTHISKSRLHEFLVFLQFNCHQQLNSKAPSNMSCHTGEWVMSHV